MGIESRVTHASLKRLKGSASTYNLNKSSVPVKLSIANYAENYP